MGGGIQDAGDAPHLDIIPATDEERQVVKSEIIETNSVREIEQSIITFSIGSFAKDHLEEVSKNRIPEIEKIEREVRNRLVQVINYWDLQASRQKEKSKQKFLNAQKQAAKFSYRLEQREAQLNRAKKISALAPIIRARMLVIPLSLINSKIDKESHQASRPQDIVKKQETEASAMEAVMRTERSLGFVPRDVSKENLGYDIFSVHPLTKKHRCIEVKGRIDEAKTVTVTRKEVVTSLHSPENYILAIVSFSDGSASEPRYVYRPFKVDSDFDVTSLFNISSIQFNLKRLLECSETPR